MTAKYEEIETAKGKPIRDVLKEEFLKHGTLTAVAKSLGVSQGTISLWLIRFGLKLRITTELIESEVQS